jgi:hypothetical protein
MTTLLRNVFALAGAAGATIATATTAAQTTNKCLPLT